MGLVHASSCSSCVAAEAEEAADAEADMLICNGVLREDECVPTPSGGASVAGITLGWRLGSWEHHSLIMLLP